MEKNRMRKRKRQRIVSYVWKLNNELSATIISSFFSFTTLFASIGSRFCIVFRTSPFCFFLFLTTTGFLLFGTAHFHIFYRRSVAFGVSPLRFRLPCRSFLLARHRRLLPQLLLLLLQLLLQQLLLLLLLPLHHLEHHLRRLLLLLPRLQQRQTIQRSRWL